MMAAESHQEKDRDTSKSEGLENRNGTLVPAHFSRLPDDWQMEWETFPSADHDLQLFGSWFHHKNLQLSPVGHRALLVLHGLGEHGGRYQHLPAAFHEQVGSVWMMDHRGHGRSEGLRGHAESFDLYCHDVKTALDRLREHLYKKTNREPEIHLLGHSMGGLVALRTLQWIKEFQVRSLILSAPFLGMKIQVPPLKRIAGELLAKTWGKFQLTNEIEAKWVSHDPLVVRAYQQDRLNHGKITPSLFKELLATLDKVNADVEKIEIPTLMLVPDQDQLVDANASLRFFDKLHAKTKALKVFPGFYHEIFNEVGRSEAFDAVRTWLRGSN